MEIIRLEQSVLEIYELFQDLATLVELQSESLDVIETRISKARDYTERAEVELHSAEDYQKKSRSKMCIMLVLLVIVLIAVLAPTLYTQLKSS